MLVRLNNEIYEQRVEIIELKALAAPGTVTSAALRADENDLQKKLHVRWWMVFGEGSVFMTLLVLGIIRTRNSFRKEAELAEQQKNFLLSVTHELKSPLASLRLQLETMNRRELPAEKMRELRTDALDDIERLNTLVENILIAARIDRNSIVLHFETIDLSTVAREVSEKAFAGKTHQLNLNIQAGLRCAVDRIGFPSVLLNLLENAMKYSPKGSMITVSLQQRKNNTLALAVVDHGIGISAEDKKKVFEKFFRAGNEETRTSKGTGLGLYIVKHLVDAHGWTIHILDTPGGGATFEISIPPGGN